MHNKTIATLFLSAFMLICTTPISARAATSVVVFSEPGFPAADSASPSASQLQTLFPGCRIAALAELKTSLKEPASRLLVLPYGSAFPEEAWGEINQFLQRGGNLLVLGGRPFTRSAYRDSAGWRLRDYSTRFTRPLMIDQYQDTPGSDGMEFQTNPELTVQLPRFSWRRAFSPVIRLSAVDLYKRGGAAGAIDARLDALAWGVKDGRKMSAPAIEVDHLRNGFNSGRWIFINAELPPGFFSSGTDTVRALAERALQGAEEFTVRPVYPLYLPGEPVQLNIKWHSAQPSTQPLTVKIAAYPDANPSNRLETTGGVPAPKSVVLSAPAGKGMYVVEAKLMEGDKVRAIYHSGFWIRDEASLSTGPKVTVNKDYFELDGKPLAVVGTTYMSSEVQRLYFEYPNVYVWDKDLGQIRARGLNMIRTGWWTGWDKFCNENGEPYERTLRTLEAYLMTARKHGLPVQWNLFAFLPEVLGGVNPYLDPEAVRRQRTLISSVAGRFHDVPWLVWDFINEPSISQRLWTMRPNGDGIELQKWNEWLNQRYMDKAALAAAWNAPASSVQGIVSLPEDIEFTTRGAYVGRNSLKVYDFYVFAQDVFDNWVKTMRDAVRATGSTQLVTVGQDEGGIQDRLAAYAVAENQLPNLGNPKLAILPSPQNLTDEAWRLLMKYVNGGGNLLITGPVERDEHWQLARRAADLKLDAQAEPLMYHNAIIRIGDRTIAVSFDQQKQNQAESLHFNDGSSFKEIAYGKGRIFWAAYPVEFGEGAQATAELYAYVAAKIGIEPSFELNATLSPGMLVYPTVLDDAVMYVMVSDDAGDAKVDLRDKLTGARLTLQLGGQRAAIALIGKKEKTVIAKYGF